MSNSTLSSQLVQALRADLMRGAFEPGQQLRLNQLCERFDVSLSPLREALSRLAAEGFVIAQDQRGYQVAPVSLANLEEVTRLRRMLECLALKESIAHGDDKWEADLVASFHRLELIERRRGGAPEYGLDEWEARHREFHLALIAACRMPVLLQFCESLLDFSDRYRRIFLRSRPLDRDIQCEHDVILQAALARDVDKAEKALGLHIERTATNVAKALRQGTETAAA